MDIENIVDLVINNGVAIAVLAYFCVRDWKFNELLLSTLTTLKNQNEILRCSTENLILVLDDLKKGGEEKND